ncbi:MAG: addiction module protein [Thermodesulfobacteriota bacterium]
METGVPLDKMTTADKLRAMEEIWADLQRNPEDIPAPAWHGDVLRSREAQEKEGISRFEEWTDAKARIRERAK